MTLELKINNDKPSNISAWNELCEKEGNFVQSVHYDAIQFFFGHRPIYLEVFEKEKLIGGVKFFYSINQKFFLNKISATLLQFGELICFSDVYFEECKSLLIKDLETLVVDKKVTTFTAYNFYGNKSKLLTISKFSATKIFEFNVAMVDLVKNEDLLKSYNRNTRRNIKKAQEANLQTVIENDKIDGFNKVLNNVYEQQNNLSGCPNLDFVKQTKEAAPEFINLCFCKDEQRIYSAVLSGDFGGTSYSWFGGTLRNEIGSGQLMYFDLMTRLQKKGFKRFYFGQIAKVADSTNEKFSVGITTFKRGFNCEEIDSHKVTYIIKPLHYKLWNFLINVRKKIR
jgi:hypothetical protein